MVTDWQSGFIFGWLAACTTSGFIHWLEARRER